MSAVMVMVIDWTVMGAPSPTATLPTLIRRAPPTDACRQVGQLEREGHQGLLYRNG